MGEIVAILGAGTGIGGTATEALGAAQEGEAEKASAVYNARLAKIQTNAQIRRQSVIQRRVRSQNVVRVAKSGVRLEGSPLEALVRSAFDQEKQIQDTLRAGTAASKLFRAQGKMGLIASRYKIAGSVFRGFGGMLGGQAGGFASTGSGGSSGTGGSTS